MAVDVNELFGRSGTGPLSGLVVADFSRVLAGPFCTMLLADLGAVVIKIESPEGDETRSWRPPIHGDESTYFLSINRNKHSIVLDFAKEADLEVARDIAAKSDVMLENFKPGGLKKFGLDYESVSAINSEIIYGSITGFGTTGGANLPGYDLLVQGLSGMMSLTGAPNTDPFRCGVAVFDVMTGLLSAVGILAALHHRTMTGEGQLVELNLMSSALAGLVNQSGAYAISGAVPSRMGNAHPSIYPYEPFATRDGMLILAVGNDGQFRRLCDSLGCSELVQETRFATNVQRSIHRDDLRPILAEYLSARTAAEWFDALAAIGIPCAPILDVKGGVDTAKRLGLDPIVTLGEGDDAISTIRNPIGFSRTQPSYDLTPPTLDNGSALIREWITSSLEKSGS
jgi:crotonobetainyl-CoA:carnitine CoA-transferase CaiB-like acyl-CoA transferase